MFTNEIDSDNVVNIFTIKLRKENNQISCRLLNREYSDIEIDGYFNLLEEFIDSTIMGTTSGIIEKKDGLFTAELVFKKDPIGMIISKVESFGFSRFEIQSVIKQIHKKALS